MEEMATIDLLFAFVEAADEVFVAGNHHHDDQAGDEGCIDEAEHGEDHVRFVVDKDVPGDLQELVAEGQRIDRQRRNQTEVKDHEKPAARKNDPFDEQLQRFHRYLHAVAGAVQIGGHPCRRKPLCASS